MDWQAAATGLLVLACAGYSVWTLVPAALRQRCRNALGLAQPAGGAGGCGGCGGCAAKTAASPAVQVVKFVRRPPAV